MRKIGTKLKLKCTQDMTPHWGNEFTVGNFYDAEVISLKRRIITKPKEYWDATSVIAQSIEWVRKGYREENMKEVIPNYISYKEKTNLFTQEIDIPFINVISELGRKYDFCLISSDELKTLYNIESVRFTTSVNFADEYFDLIQIKRDLVLNELFNIFK